MNRLPLVLGLVGVALAAFGAIGLATGSDPSGSTAAPSTRTAEPGLGDPDGPDRSEPPTPDISGADRSTADPRNTTPDTAPDVPDGAANLPAQPVDAGADADGDVVATHVSLPTLGVESTLIDLDLAEDGTLEVPEDFDLAGWYVRRAGPGEPGPLIVVGHVDSYTGPAIFFRLPELVPGELVSVTRDDGRIARYRVTKVEQHSKEEFPTDEVYGWTDESTIRLITCGGDFDEGLRSYDDNVIVFGDLVDVISAPTPVGSS